MNKNNITKCSVGLILTFLSFLSPVNGMEVNSDSDKRKHHISQWTVIEDAPRYWLLKEIIKNLSDWDLKEVIKQISGNFTVFDYQMEQFKKDTDINGN